MPNSLVVELNLQATITQQDNKCLDCETELNPDNVYFRMDQAIYLYEVYCEKCGLIWEKKDKEARRVIV